MPTQSMGFRVLVNISRGPFKKPNLLEGFYNFRAGFARFLTLDSWSHDSFRFLHRSIVTYIFIWTKKENLTNTRHLPRLCIPHSPELPRASKCKRRPCSRQGTKNPSYHSTFSMQVRRYFIYYLSYKGHNVLTWLMKLAPKRNFRTVRWTELFSSSK